MSQPEATWIAADGSALRLSNGSDGLYLLWGRKGADMPPVDLIAENVPLQPGARLRDIRTRARDIDLPILVKAASASALRTKIRDVLRSFDPLRGDGTLRLATAAGDSRQIACRYAAGLSGEEGTDAAGASWRRIVLTLRAFDPYWEDVNPSVTSISLSTGFASIPYTVETYQDVIVAPAWNFFSNPFLPFGRLVTKQRVLTTTTAYKTGRFFPFFPLTMSNSILFASVSISNAGDVEAWPTWTINGPGTDIILNNTTTGERLELIGYSLGSGEQITIDTRPNHKSIVKGTSNLFSLLSSSSRLWSLSRGTNGVTVEMGGTDTNSRVTLQFTPRHLGL